LLRLAQRASSSYTPSEDNDIGDAAAISRQTIELFFKFLTSRTGLLLKRPLVHELAQAIDGIASLGEASLLRMSNGLLPALPGMNGPVNNRVMDEMRAMLDTFQGAVTVGQGSDPLSQGQARMQAMQEVVNELAVLLADERLRKDAEPLLQEVRSVIQMVALEVLEIRGSRAMRAVLRLG
jgi:hypothetical protein